MYEFFITKTLIFIFQITKPLYDSHPTNRANPFTIIKCILQKPKFVFLYMDDSKKKG